MSEETTPQESDRSSEPSPTSPPAAAEAGTPEKQKKPRSPLERFLVWSLIVVLAAIAGIEGYTRWKFAESREALSAALKDVDSGRTDDLLVGELDQLLTGTVTMSDVISEGKEDYIECRWWSLFRSNDYVLRLRLALTDVSKAELASGNLDKAVVLEAFTPGAPEEETPAPPPLPVAGDGDEDETEGPDVDRGDDVAKTGGGKGKRGGRRPREPGEQSAEGAARAESEPGEEQKEAVQKPFDPSPAVAAEKPEPSTPE